MMPGSASSCYLSIKVQLTYNFSRFSYSFLIEKSFEVNHIKNRYHIIDTLKSI